jgi:hypothetical protein
MAGQKNDLSIVSVTNFYIFANVFLFYFYKIACNYLLSFLVKPFLYLKIREKCLENLLLATANLQNKNLAILLFDKVGF